MTGSRPADWLLSLLAWAPCWPSVRTPARAAEAPLRVAVTFPAERSAQPIDGRLLLLDVGGHRGRAALAGERHRQDRPGVRRGCRGLETRRASQSSTPQRLVTRSARWRALPKGTYLVQALVNRYETFKRSDGLTVKLPPDKGEGQQWARKPGNLYSTPAANRRWTRRRTRWSAWCSTRKLPPVDDFAKQETKYVKYVRIRSERLSKFWGRDMYLGRVGPAAVGFRRSSRRALSAGDQPRALPVEHRRAGANTAGPRPEARLQRALPARRLQPDPAGAGAPVLQGLDRDRVSRACC